MCTTTAVARFESARSISFYNPREFVRTYVIYVNAKYILMEDFPQCLGNTILNKAVKPTDKPDKD